MQKLLPAFLGAMMMNVGGALAADLPVKAPPKPPYSWSGCYVGGNFGSVFATQDWALAAPSAPAGTALGSQSANDLLVGGQVGCNYQAGIWVFGLQGDYDETNASGTAVDNFNAGFTDRSKITGLASVTGRIGLVWGELLSYVKGGGAWQRDAYDRFVTGLNPSLTSVSATRDGWTVGGGFEYAITPNLSLFFEYDFYDFGTRANTFIVAPPAVQTVGIRESESVVKMGGNWKFNWW